MAVQRLHSAMAPIDILTREELEQSQRKQLDAFWYEKYRGESFQEYNTTVSPAAATATIPGPDSGYSWSVKLVAAVLSTAGSLAVLLGDNVNTAPVGGGSSIVAASLNLVAVQFGSNAVVVQDQRVLTLQSAGISQPVPSQPAVPATGVAQQNNNPYPVSVVISANGATITNVSVNGVTVGTAAGTYSVPAFGSISIAYSVATPTWVWSNLNGLSTTANIGAVKIIYKQVPSEMVGKL